MSNNFPGYISEYYIIISSNKNVWAVEL